MLLRQVSWRRPRSYRIGARAALSRKPRLPYRHIAPEAQRTAVEAVDASSVANPHARRVSSVAGALLRPLEPGCRTRAQRQNEWRSMTARRRVRHQRLEDRQATAIR